MRFNDDVSDDPFPDHYSDLAATDHGDDVWIDAIDGVHRTDSLREPNPQWRGRPFDNRRSRTGQTSTGASAEFWKVWVAHRDYLLHLAVRWMSGNRADAEDLLSRACIKAHDRYLRDENRIRNIRSWIARLLHNCCMDEHRKRLVRSRVLSQFHPDQINFLSLCITWQDIPEQVSDVNESIGEVFRVILGMPLRIRYPFVLRFIYQYSNHEVALLLSISEVNVRKRIQIGRSILKSVMVLPE